MTRQELIDRATHHAKRADELLVSLDAILGNDEIVMGEDIVEAMRVVTAGAHAYAAASQAFSALHEMQFGGGR